MNNKKRDISGKKYTVIGLIAGLVNGLFGGGGGTIIVPTLAKSPSYGQKRAQATAMAVTTPISAVSATLCLFDGLFPLKKGLAVVIGVCVGGIIGAKILNKINKGVAEKFFYALITVLGVKMLFA